MFENGACKNCPICEALNLFFLHNGRVTHNVGSLGSVLGV